MSLMTAHKIFISTSIVFCLVFSVREVLEYTQTGSVGALLLGVSSGVGFVVLSLYLRSLFRQ